MSPDTSQPQTDAGTGDLRYRAALVAARVIDSDATEPTPEDYEIAQALIPLVAKAQRDESAKALTEYALTYNDAAMSFAAEFVRNEPLITEDPR